MLKKVIIICDGAGVTGGTEKVAIVTASELADRGYDVLFFAGEGELAPELTSRDKIRTHCMGLKDAYTTTSKRELLSRFFWNKDSAPEFRSVVEKAGFNPADTVVHVHAFRRVLSGAVVKEAKRMGFKIAFTLHDFGLVCPNTSLFNFPQEKLCTIKPMSAACFTSQCTHSGWPMKMMQMGRGTVLALKGVARDFDQFIYVSDFSRKIIEKYIPADTPQRVIYNPIDVEKGLPAKPDVNDVFTMVGRLSPEKGGRLFAEAAKRAGVKCQFVGKGPEAEEILKINPEAIMSGWVSAQEVEALTLKSRAIVMPSLWYETAGLSVIEATSRGVPIIVSDQCAAVEYVKNNHSGIIFDGGNVESLAQALKAMTTTEAQRMGANAFDDFWADPLSTERHFGQLLAVYENMLSYK